MTKSSSSYTVKAFAEVIAKVVRGRVWAPQNRDNELVRIYVDSGRRDAKTYFQYDPENLCFVLRIGLDDCDQSSNWYTSQKRAIASSLWPITMAVGCLGALLSAAPHDGGNTIIDDETISAATEAAAKILEIDPPFTDAQIDAAASHFANGRWREGAKELGVDAS